MSDFPNGRVFFDEDADTAGDRDGDDSAEKSEHVGANNHGDEDDDGAEFQSVALDFRSNKVDLDEAIDDIEGEPDNGHKGASEGEDEGDERGTDDLAEHGD